MVPDKSHPRFRELVTGEYGHSFSGFPANMCLSNCQRRVRARGEDPTVVDAAVEEVHAFLQKFETEFAEDIRRIFG